MSGEGEPDPKRWVAVILSRDEWLNLTPAEVDRIAKDHAIPDEHRADLLETLATVGAAYAPIRHNEDVSLHAPARVELQNLTIALQEALGRLADLSDKARHLLDCAACLEPADVENRPQGRLPKLQDGTLGRPRVNAARDALNELTAWAGKAAEPIHAGGRPPNEPLIYVCFELMAWWHVTLGRPIKIGRTPKRRQLLGFLCDAVRAVDPKLSEASVRNAAVNARQGLFPDVKETPD